MVEAVIMPNTTSERTDPVEDHAKACANQNDAAIQSAHDDWASYRTTVSAIEAASGLSFSFLH